MLEERSVLHYQGDEIVPPLEPSTDLEGVQNLANSKAKIKHSLVRGKHLCRPHLPFQATKGPTIRSVQHG